MAQMFNFFLYCGGELFTFLGSAEIFSGLSILQFLVANIVLLLIVDNFIIKAGKGSSSGHNGRVKSKAPKSKEGAGGSGKNA